MNSKTTKRALFSSFWALLLCFAMLLGTTFAWFTDTASTSVNKIQAGTLDVKLEMATDWNDDGSVKTWADAEGKVLNFIKADAGKSQEVLWEPGCTYKLPEIRIVNNGNLALKYQVAVTAKSEGNADLSEVLNVTLKDGNGEAQKLGKLKTLLAASNGIVATDKKLAANSQTDALLLTLSMDTTAGNEYQGASISGIAVTVVATQDTVEYDSTTNEYDKDATYPEVKVVGNNSAEVGTTLRPDANAENPNVYLTLSEDTNLSVANLGTQVGGSGQYRLGNANTTDIVIDLAGHKLTIDTGYWSALGAVNPNATITVKNGSMTSSQPSGTWNSYDLTFYDCNWVFENVTFEKAVAFATGANATLKNVTINETHDYYALWITLEGQTITLDDVTINSSGRGIVINNQYVAAPSAVTLNINGGDFNTAKKAAVLVKNTGEKSGLGTGPAYADEYKNVGATVNVSGTPDISNVTADTTNMVWRDSANTNVVVNVTGCTVIDET